MRFHTANPSKDLHDLLIDQEIHENPLIPRDPLVHAVGELRFANLPLCPSRKSHKGIARTTALHCPLFFFFFSLFFVSYD